MIKIKLTWDQYWYIVKDEQYYLHPDLEWRTSTTVNDYKGYTGLYKSEEEAQKVLDKYLKTHDQQI